MLRHATFWLLWLQSYNGSAFAPHRNARKNSFQVTRPSSTFLVEEAPPAEQTPPIDSAAALLSDYGDHVVDCANVLLDMEKYPPGSVSTYVLNEAVPILQALAKTETIQGAQAAEQVLTRMEHEEEELTNYHYTLAVDAWGKSGHEESGQKAVKILDRMQEMADTHPEKAPNRVAFNAALNAFARQGDALGAAALLERMEETSFIEVTTKDYNALLRAHAISGQPREAEQLVKRMVDRCKSEDDTCRPDLFTYNSLLDAWAKSDEKDAGQRAEEILSMLLLRYEAGEIDSKPDSCTYSAVISALIKNGGQEALERSQELFAEAQARGITPDVYLHAALLKAYADSTKDGAIEKAEELLNQQEAEGMANAVSYNTVINGWKINGSPARAEALLRRMVEKGFADTISYSTVIAAYANRGKGKSPQRAEEIFQQMQDAFEGGNEAAKPNVQAFNSVLNAWVNSGNAARAEEVLQKMEKERLGGIVPNVVSYSTVLHGWAKSRHKNSMERVKGVYERLIASFESGNVQAQPNLFTFVTLINAIVKSRQEDAAQQAEEILFQMYDQYQEGNMEARPNTKLVTSVIDCWQRSGERNAGERAEALLDWMLDIYKANGRPLSLQPNEYTFNAVISAWGKSRAFGKAFRARAVLDRMIQMHKSGEIRSAPNIFCYTAVINSCAYCENDPDERKSSLQLALQTFKDLSDYTAPSSVTFVTLLTAARNLIDPGPSRAVFVGKIFERACKDGQVDEFVLRRVGSALPLQDQKKLLNEAVQADGSIDIEKIPSEWSRNTNRRGR